jgi:hypothetical protein
VASGETLKSHQLVNASGVLRVETTRGPGKFRHYPLVGSNAPGAPHFLRFLKMAAAIDRMHSDFIADLARGL